MSDEIRIDKTAVCGNCCYGKEDGKNHGYPMTLCRFSPRFIRHSSLSWCGKHPFRFRKVSLDELREEASVNAELFRKDAHRGEPLKGENT